MGANNSPQAAHLLEVYANWLLWMENLVTCTRQDAVISLSFRKCAGREKKVVPNRPKDTATEVADYSCLEEEYQAMPSQPDEGIQCGCRFRTYRGLMARGNMHMTTESTHRMQPVSLVQKHIRKQRNRDQTHLLTKKETEKCCIDFARWTYIVSVPPIIDARCAVCVDLAQVLEEFQVHITQGRLTLCNKSNWRIPKCAGVAISADSARKARKGSGEGEEKMHGSAEDKLCSAILALQTLRLHTEGLGREHAAAVQEFWLVPLNSKPVKAAMDAGMDYEEEGKRPRTFPPPPSPPSTARGSCHSGRVGHGHGRQTQRSAVELQLTVVYTTGARGRGLTDVQSQSRVRSRGRYKRGDPLCSDIPEWLQKFRENLTDDRVPERGDSHASTSHEDYLQSPH